MTQSATTPPPASRTEPAKKQTNHAGSVKETLESILVAFILAFIFRAFIVEAFVIPTGSMGPTLLGAHMRFRCNDCGYNFTANYGADQTPDGDIIIPSETTKDYHVFCPNCGYKFPDTDVKNPDNDGSNQPIHYGDRILVLKYLYLFNEPQRWDVVVFKSPAPDAGIRGEPTYKQNYIKRLVGKPGESIMILDGDIYKGKPGDSLDQYIVQTKPRYAQEAMWRVIYDNDYHPAGVDRGDRPSWIQPWTVRDGQGWDLGKGMKDGRAFRFNNTTGESTIFFNRDANLSNRPMTDWLAYDVVESTGPSGETDRRRVVHDLKVAFDYDRQAGDGPLQVRLSDGTTTFAGIITPTDATLARVGGSDLSVIGTAKIKPGKRPLRIEMTNADYQVFLRVNGIEVARTTPQHYQPNIAGLLSGYKANPQRPDRPWPTVEISAGRQTSSIEHVGLWRDIYYQNHRPEMLYGTPRSAIDLGEEEYFVLGDNSEMSFDARFWNVPIDLPADELDVRAGRVPGRFMLGRAFFVYWPAGFRPVRMLPSIAPNFGEMRFIR